MENREIDNWPVFKLPPLSILLITIGGVLVGMFLFVIVATFIVVAGFGVTPEEVQNLLTAPDNSQRTRLLLFIIQGITALGTFVVAPLVLQRYLVKESFNDEGAWRFSPPIIFLLAALSIPAINYFIDYLNTWNQTWSFGSYQEALRLREDAAAKLTEILTSFTSVGEYLLAMVVIAVIPAVGEELLFRGIVQTQLIRMVRNPWVGIIIAAVIFSAFHVQFFGFLPRAVLGLLLGFYFYKTGNIYVSMLAHFVNNGLTVTLMWLNNLKVIDIPANGQDATSLGYALASAVATAGIVYYINHIITRKEQAA